MLHQGTHARLYEGTVCILHAPGQFYDGERCTVVARDAAKKKWRVRLDFDSRPKTLLVREDSLSLGFCILPSALATVPKW